MITEFICQTIAMWTSACMLSFTTVAIALVNTLFLVKCDGTKALRDAVVSVLVVQLEGGWLWLQDVVPELLEGMRLEMVEA